MGTLKVQQIVRKVLQTPLFLQRNACGTHPRLPVCTHTLWRSMLEMTRLLGVRLDGFIVATKKMMLAHVTRTFSSEYAGGGLLHFFLQDYRDRFLNFLVCGEQLKPSIKLIPCSTSPTMLLIPQPALADSYL